MKIACVRWTPYRIPFREAYSTSLGMLTQREGLIVQLVTDDGRIGLGEAAPTPEALGAARALERAMAQVAPALLDKNPAQNEPPTLNSKCARDVAAALGAALDTALCDLVAQEKDITLARLLKGDAVENVAVNALVAWNADPAGAARAAAANGFATIKLKVGLPSIDADLRCIASVRDEIGPDVKLRLDPNGAWSIDRAVRTINSLAEYDLEYVEQPIPPGDLNGLRRLQAAVDVPIAADEDVTDLETARRIVESGAAQLLVLKPQRLGGLRASQQVVEMANAAGLRCVVTTSIEAGAGTAACLHLAAALPPGSPASGLATAGLLASELTTPQLTIEHGAMRVPATAGLGVQLDGAAMAKYAGAWREVS